MRVGLASLKAEDVAAVERLRLHTHDRVHAKRLDWCPDCNRHRRCEHGNIGTECTVGYNEA